jgi:hypothetical protein
MAIDRKTVIVCVICVAAGWWLASSPASPVNPPAKDRPVLRAIAKVAKLFLWVALAAEKPPENAERTYVVHARVDENGQPLIDHARGW